VRVIPCYQTQRWIC